MISCTNSYLKHQIYVFYNNNYKIYYIIYKYASAFRGVIGASEIHNILKNCTKYFKHEYYDT